MMDRTHLVAPLYADASKGELPMLLTSLNWGFEFLRLYHYAIVCRQSSKLEKANWTTCRFDFCQSRHFLVV
jgi:hypothetical protein